MQQKKQPRNKVMVRRIYGADLYDWIVQCLSARKRARELELHHIFNRKQRLYRKAIALKLDIDQQMALLQEMYSRTELTMRQLRAYQKKFRALRGPQFPQLPCHLERPIALISTLVAAHFGVRGVPR